MDAQLAASDPSPQASKILRKILPQILRRGIRPDFANKNPYLA
jgi:hypothetical protein